MTLDEQKFENPELKESVEKNNPLKTLFVDYVGEKKNPEDGNVTLEMIIDVLAEEFPEFVLAVAEENFIRGYKQAMVDVDSEKKMSTKKNKKSK